MNLTIHGDLMSLVGFDLFTVLVPFHGSVVFRDGALERHGLVLIALFLLQRYSESDRFLCKTMSPFKFGDAIFIKNAQIVRIVTVVETISY